MRFSIGELVDDVWLARVTGLGFSVLRDPSRLYRQESDLGQVIFAGQHDEKGGGGVVVRLGVGIESKLVERILLKAQCLEAVEGGISTILRTSVSRLLAGLPSEWLVTGEASIQQARPDLQRAIADGALPWLSQFKSLKDVDFAINENRSEPYSWTAPEYFRCSVGAAVATLVKRPDREAVLDDYLQKMKKISRGFYLSRFEGLVSLLSGLVGLGADEIDRRLQL